MKVILLSVLATLALGSLSGISVSHKDNGKLAENKLNANIDLDNDPYCEYSSVVYNVDLDKENYFTGHGNPDWYRIEDEVQITDVSQIDLNTVEYLNYTNNTATTFFNVQIEFSKYISGFSISIAAYTPLTEGQIVINYRFHRDPYPESYYNDIDDSFNELLPVVGYADDSGDNDKSRFSKIVKKRGTIEGTINTYNWWIAFWNGSEIDQDWYRFTIDTKYVYTFKFKAPNNEYVFSFYSYDDLDKTPTFTLYGVGLTVTQSRTITLYPGTYCMRVTVGNKDFIRDDKYRIEYDCQKPANNKVLLKPDVMKTTKMAVWNNDILSDVIPNKFKKEKYHLYHGTSKDLIGFVPDYIDPILYTGPVLDSMLIIWDKDICRCIASILENKTAFTTIKRLAEENNQGVELVFEAVDQGLYTGIDFIVQKAGDIILKITGITFQTIANISAVLKIAECVAKIICCFFCKPHYTAEEIAFYFGNLWGCLYSAADAVADAYNEDWAIFIPIYGKLSRRDSYEGPQPTQQNPRPIWYPVVDFYWERSLFEPGKYNALFPAGLRYKKHCISQYQTIRDDKDSEWKRTSHGTIKLLSDTDEVLNYIYNGLKNL